jgi:hypothetical protein
VGRKIKTIISSSCIPELKKENKQLGFALLKQKLRE